MPSEVARAERRASLLMGPVKHVSITAVSAEAPVGPESKMEVTLTELLQGL